MKLFVVLCFVAVACAAPPYEGAQVLRYENDNIGIGSYRHAFEQSDGTQQEAVGELKNGETVVVRGSYSWNAPDGLRYVVTYEADELGYRSTIDKQGVANTKYTSVV
ncbi:flexible cuticle protein 12-like [Vanessa atalanta]|uniref:flexible cuticle protein 12-like n=1 Tax=Vanessa atalanta TaxID=42275 RepID=UPI001FCD7BEF|nr:flexible cuticle protein 12-like [Vanessa atalanta]